MQVARTHSQPLGETTSSSKSALYPLDAELARRCWVCLAKLGVPGEYSAAQAKVETPASTPLRWGNSGHSCLVWSELATWTAVDPGAVGTNEEILPSKRTSRANRARLNAFQSTFIFRESHDSRSRWTNRTFSFTFRD